MANAENQSAITLYPGSQPITLQEHHRDEWDVEGEPFSYTYPWAARYRTASGPHTSHVISRELALAAARQSFAWGQPAASARYYNIPQLKAVLSGREEEVPVRKAEASTEQGLSHEPTVELRRLEEKVKFLEAQLHSQMPYLQLYRLGAGSLFVAIISIVIWLLTGTGIPFHPVFAAGVIPAALGVIAMAFLVRPAKPTKSNK